MIFERRQFRGGRGGGRKPAAKMIINGVSLEAEAAFGPKAMIRHALCIYAQMIRTLRSLTPENRGALICFLRGVQ